MRINSRATASKLPSLASACACLAWVRVIKPIKAAWSRRVPASISVMEVKTLGRAPGQSATEKQRAARTETRRHRPAMTEFTTALGASNSQ